MSKRVLNPNQLAMFMRPAEIKANTFPGDFDPRLDRGHANMWHEKEQDNWINDMDTEVEAHGVTDPVTVVHGPDGAKWAGDPQGARKSGKPVLADGHHRVQAADAAERNGKKEVYVPVTHTDKSPWGPQSDRGDKMREAADNWFQFPIQS